jgi:dTDP-4-dehydrorhamnose reductase
MRVLITGAAGYLGRRTCAAAGRRGHDVVAVVRDGPVADQIAADITDARGFETALRGAAADVVIHAAAINPGQGDEARMMAVNRDGTRNVARAAAAVGAHLVHVSSDMVHAGDRAPYPDDADPAPINVYGRSKAAAEREALDAAPGAAIVRTSLIYGLQQMDRGTAGFAARLAAGEPLALFTDVLRQPVWVETLAEALVRLAEGRLGGRFNVAGEQVLSREGFGRRMLDWWGVPGRGQVTAGVGAHVSAKIPLDLRLDLDRARASLALELPGVDEVLARHH